MDWYKHHITDYMEATRELNMLQDGAYRRLLDVYYQQELPLKVEERVIFRLINALHWREKEAARYVLGKFFVPLEGRWHNTRADEEIAKYQAQRVANRRPNREPNRSPILPPNRPLDKKERYREDGCAEFLEDGSKCGKPSNTKLGNKWVCAEHNPYALK